MKDSAENLPQETPVEYEVYNPTLEHYGLSLTCADSKGAGALSIKLESVSGLGWYVRAVPLKERPVSFWSSVPTAISVSEARSLAARHGQRGMVIIAWDGQTTNMVSVGSTPENS